MRKPCDKTTCLNNDKKGVCDLNLDFLQNQTRPHSIECKFFEENLMEEYKKLKERGGMQYLIRRESSPDYADTKQPVKVASGASNPVRKSYEFNGYTISRMKDRSYYVFKGEKQVPAKHALIMALVHEGMNKKDLEKKGTRHLGNILFQMKFGGKY